jgi:hypothetical protein
MKTFDREKYVVRVRRGKPILVDKQILKWRKARKKAEARAQAEQTQAELQSQLADVLSIKFFGEE